MSSSLRRSHAKDGPTTPVEVRMRRRDGGGRVAPGDQAMAPFVLGRDTARDDADDATTLQVLVVFSGTGLLLSLVSAMLGWS